MLQEGWFHVPAIQSIERMGKGQWSRQLYQSILHLSRCKSSTWSKPKGGFQLIPILLRPFPPHRLKCSVLDVYGFKKRHFLSLLLNNIYRIIILFTHSQNSFTGSVRFLNGIPVRPPILHKVTFTPFTSWLVQWSSRRTVWFTQRSVFHLLLQSLHGSSTYINNAHSL